MRSSKVAIVSGGAHGIGEAAVRAFAREGYRVALADVDRKAGARLAEDGRVLFIPADVSRSDDAWDVVRQTTAAFGGVDVVFNNAGIQPLESYRTVETLDEGTWDRVMDVNVLSMFLTCRAVVPRMRERGGGAIVNISSGTPFRGVPFLLHYVTSKGAIVALTRALAKELGKDGVRVNCVAPGFTMSEGVKQHPEVIEQLRDVSVAARTIQRDQEPEDVVGAAVYLAGPSSSFVTGQTIVIDGGAILK